MSALVSAACADPSFARTVRRRGGGPWHAAADRTRGSGGRGGSSSVPLPIPDLGCGLRCRWWRQQCWQRDDGNAADPRSRCCARWPVASIRVGIGSVSTPKLGVRIVVVVLFVVPTGIHQR